jgi:hypothetical protein
MRRRGACVLVLGVVVLGVVAVGSATATTAPDCSTVTYSTDGSGAFVVENVSQLQCLGNQSTNTSLSDDFVLSEYIDASGTAEWNDGRGFDPIGNESDPFTGTFDGTSHTIIDLRIDRPDSENVGLFGVLGRNAVVESVTLGGATVRGDVTAGVLAGFNGGTVRSSSATGTVTGFVQVGGLVGSAGDVKRPGIIRGTVRSSSAAVRVNGTHDVGGLVGYNAGTVRVSYATGNVTGTEDIGGLVGYNTLGARVNSSYATGPVTGDNRIGGLAGSNAPGTIVSSYAVGTVTGATGVGGLVGLNTGGTVRSSYWDVNATGQDSSAGTGLATGQMKGSAATSNMAGFDFTETWDVLDTANGTAGSYPLLQANAQTPPPGRTTGMYAGGTGTAANPYQIANWYHLNDTRHHLGANFTLVADLTELMPGYAAVAGQTANNGSGFVPIGERSNRPFTGAFDGNNHTIGSLSIDRPDALDVGLFGYVGEGGVIENTALADATVRGNVSVGPLVGLNTAGTVRSSSATGRVTGSTSVGGLVGSNDGMIVSSSGATAVTGDESIGGLVGTTAGSVNTSFATGPVTGSATATASRVGGLVGNLNGGGTVQSSYATGNVTGDERVGGLVGKSLAGTVQSSYATGRVTGSGGKVGGLVGMGGTVGSSYWDLNTTGQNTSAGGSGLTTAQLKGSAATRNMSGFDFTGTWDVLTADDDAAASYPFLRTGTQTPAPGRTAETYAGGTGTAASPYRIANWNHLQNVRQQSGANFTLVADLDRSTPGYERVAGSTANDGRGFDPVGGDETPDPFPPEEMSDPFTGTFDGANHTIAGLRIDRPEATGVGLFGATGTRAVIEDLRLDNASVRGNERVGGLVGNNTGTVHSSVVTGAVTGTSRVGGLVGTNAETIRASSATAAVTGDNQVGGLVGENGEVRVRGSATVELSTASGRVNGNNSIGGLVGRNAERVRSSSATGAVTGDASIGGLVGSSIGEVRSSYATGPVAGDSRIGGLVGAKLGGWVQSSYAAGRVNGSSDVGGLVGDSTGSGTAQSSYWDLNTTGQATSSGGTGLTTAQMKGNAATRNMAGLKFTTTWQVVPGGYPALAGVESVGPPPVVGDAAPTDPDNDGRYEDVNGRNGFNIIDVQALFNNLGTAKLNNNTAAFDFFQVRTEVDILDVQELFDELDASG